MDYDYGNLASPDPKKDKGDGYDYGDLATPVRKYAAPSDVQGPMKDGPVSKGEDQPKERSLLGKLGHQAELTGRYVTEGLAGMGDLPNQVLNLIPGVHLGMPSEVAGRRLTQAGVQEPETPAERIVGSASKALVGSAVPTGGAGLAKPITQAGKGVAEALAARPAFQAASGAASGAAGQGAAEAKLPPWAQEAASVAAGALPFGKGPPREVTPSMKGELFKDARAHGYVVTPSDVQHTSTGNIMESITNKQKLTAKTSVKNAEARASDIRQELGLGKGSQISEDELDHVRDNAYGAFKDLVTELKANGPVIPTPEFEAGIKHIGDKAVGLKDKYSNLVDSPTRKRIDVLTKELLRPHDAEDTVELIKSLRRQASSNLSAPLGKRLNPFKESLGHFQYEAANGLEALVEENLKDPALVDAMRAARKTIAQTYDVQYALNPATGEVSGSRLAKRLGPQTTGALKRAAEFAKAFPADNRDVARVGGTPSYNAWDFLVAGGTAMAGHPGLAVGELASRGGIPSVLSSDWYQNRIRPQGSLGAPPPSGFPPAMMRLFGQSTTEPPPQ